MSTATGCTLLALTLSLSLAATPGLAEPVEPAPSSPSSDTESEWYGWQNAAFDGLAGLLYPSTFADANPELAGS